jgi:anti-sigma-K factor RskA
MRFGGVAPNDPTEQQYQLWIFDATRPEATPVDGGVFDIGESGEVIVPINAKLPVREAAAFAITVEQPGGVVVSDRSRLALLAAKG